MAFFFDFVYTTAVAVLAARIATNRYLAARTPNQLAVQDVKTLRLMRDELKMLLMLDEQGMWTMPEKNRDRIRALVAQHDNTKELPA